MLTRDRLDELVPIEPAAMKDRQVIEWDRDDIDTLKLMKVDCLALGMLSCMKRCFDFLEADKGIKHDLTSILAEEPATYAMRVPLFQEQAMRVAIECAGFTAGEADQLRRSMATFKFTGGVSKFKEKLVNGMVANGYEREFAEKTFRQLEGFGSYGFPESHAASFALIAYAIVDEVPPSGGVLCGSAELPAHGLLCPGSDREGCPGAWCGGSARLYQCLPLGLHP